MNSPFSIEESLRFGWQKTKEHSMLIFQVLLTLFAVQVFYSIVNKTLEHTVIGGLAGFVISVGGIILGIGFLQITLKLAREEKAEYKDIVPPLNVAWTVFLVSLLTGVITFVGFLLLIIPGVYFALRFSMVRFAVLDGASVFEGIDKSTLLTKGVKWEILLFFVVFAVLNIIGAIVFFVGLLVTIPVTMIAYAHVYEKLKHHHAAAGHPAEHHHEHDHAHEGHEHHNHEGHEHHDHPHQDNA